MHSPKLLHAARGRVDAGTAARLEPPCQAKADIDWQDAAARKAVLGELVDATRELRAAVAGIDDADAVELAGLLDRSSTRTSPTTRTGLYERRIAAARTAQEDPETKALCEATPTTDAPAQPR